jgi:WD40 repeat protein
MCNVWEPDALVRPEDHDLEDASSMAESFAATEPVISQDESSENQVTAFAAGPDDSHYCCGKEDGTVTIHEAVGGAKVRKIYGHSATRIVISLAWSKSGRYIVSSDDSGRVISKRLEVKEAGKLAVFPGLDIRINEAVQQFVFSNDEKLLLISTPSKDLVWDLKGKIELCSRRHEQLRSGKWIADPMNAEMLLLVCNEIVCPYKWTTLECSDPSHLPLTAVKPPNEPKGAVRRLSLTKDGRNLVYEVIPSQSSDGLQILILATSSLNHSWKVELSCQVKRLIGTFHDRIVFLDSDYWLCTWEIDAGSSDVKRHFFLPKNWLNTSTLQMAILNDQGTFFCPRFGKVIIVRNGVRL